MAPPPGVLGPGGPRGRRPRGGSLGPGPPMRLRDALAQSRNIVAAQLVTELSPQALIDHARAVGLSGELPAVPSLALGVASVTPLEMTNAYTTWAAGGRFAPPRLVTRIVGPDGQEPALPPSAAARPAVSAAEAPAVTPMLTTVTERGTGQRPVHPPPPPP